MRLFLPRKILKSWSWHFDLQTRKIKTPGSRGGIFFINKKGNVIYGRRPDSAGKYKKMAAGDYIRGDIVEILRNGKPSGMYVTIVHYNKQEDVYLVTFPDQSPSYHHNTKFNPWDLGKRRKAKR